MHFEIPDNGLTRSACFAELGCVRSFALGSASTSNSIIAIPSPSRGQHLRGRDVDNTDTANKIFLSEATPLCKRCGKYVCMRDSMTIQLYLQLGIS